MEQSNRQHEPIAIIGLNLKFPGNATSVQAFWDMLENGLNASCEVPASRFNIDAFYHPDPARLDSIRVRKASFMAEDPRAFDAAFFNMSPAEASILDPQQRGLLEGAYHTFENAGIAMECAAGSKTSVFCASFGRDSDAIVARDPAFQSRYQATASGSSMLSNRISHFFDLRGPSLTVDTACSSGLYAVHLAYQSILAGESDMSLVCGSNTYITPECMSLPLSNAGFLSPDGRSYSFDKKGNGYGRGEGYAFVLLKPLHKALEAGNPIRAVIRATGVNQDGRTPSITQPSSQAQADLIRSTYEAAGLSLDDTGYVEAHGTGTPVGDPLEAAAISQVFKTAMRNEPLVVGSVKSNIGHLEGASGLAGLLKTVLTLERGVIPPIADFEEANPAIQASVSGIHFPARPLTWQKPTSGFRRASVSSFGYGGSNAHVVLDDACSYLQMHGLQGCTAATGLVCRSGFTNGAAEHTNGTNDINGHAIDNGTNGFSRTNCSSSVHDDASNNIPPVLLTFAAADEAGPQRQATALQSYLESYPPQLSNHVDNEFLVDVAHTLSRRSLMSWRVFAVATSEAQIRKGVVDILSPVHHALPSKTPNLVFIFTGQGAQYARMGVGLMRYYVFRQNLHMCDEFLRSLGCGWSIMEELSALPESSNINEANLSQPLCTALQVAMVDLFRSWSIVPQSVCGHSSGEVAAAYCAGGLDRKSAWKIAYFRGIVSRRVSSDSTRGKTTMMAVGLSREAVLKYLSHGVSVACVNSPSNVTLSGPVDDIDAIAETLDKAHIFARKLSVKVAYHSRFMEVVATDYHNLIRDISKPNSEIVKGSDDGSSGIRFYSSTNGERLDTLSTLTEPAYWVKNLVSPVLFSDALEAMVKDQSRGAPLFFVEMGPQGALRRPVQETMTQLFTKTLKDKWRYTCILKKDAADERSILEAVGTIWASGVAVDLDRLNQDVMQASRKPKHVLDLPSYPFARPRELWEESRLSRNFAMRQHRRHALLGARERDWNSGEASWRHLIRHHENPWILDHALNGSPLYPGSGMLVMAIEAARQLASASVEDRIRGYRLDNVRFLRSIDANDTERGSEAKIVLQPRRQTTNSGSQQFCYDWRVFGINNDDWIECAHGSIQVEIDPQQGTEAEQVARSEARRARIAASVRNQVRAVTDKCRLVVHPSQVYKHMSELSGFDYGPYFQCLGDISYDREGHATATLRLRDFADKMTYAAEDPCVIHPTTLDAICHLQMVALSQGGWNAVPTMMFSHLRKLWVSHKLFTAEGNPQLRAATKETMRYFREAECRTLVTLEGSEEPVVILEGQRGTAITSLASSEGTAASAPESRQWLYGLDYKPDLSLLRSEEAQDYLASVFRQDPRCSSSPKEKVDRADAIALHYIELALDAIDKETAPPMQFEDHLGRYVKWMRRIRQERSQWTLESRGLGHLNMEDVLKDADYEPTQRLTKKVGQHLYQILKGSENALQVIFEGNLADEFYHCDVFATNNSKMGAYIDILAHKNPKLRLLEVGAGTGSFTGRIMPYLAPGEEGGAPVPVRFGEYVYTDVSAGFFEKARERFSFVGDYMKFQKLDLEQTPTSQGYSDGMYDVVVAGNVLHATKDLVQTLRYVKGLLRPGGVLLLGEAVNLDNVRDGLIFGLLPGWWLREGQWWATNDEYKDQGPLLTEPQWDTVLREAGFPGVQMVFRDHEEKPHHRVSIIVSARPDEEKLCDTSLPTHPVGVNPYRIIFDPNSPLQRLIAEALQDRIAREITTGVVVLCVIEDAVTLNTQQIQDEVIVNLIDLERPLLESRSDAHFSAIKTLCLGSRFMVWLTYGAAPEASNPWAEAVAGFGRSVCSERGDQGFITLSVSERPGSPSKAVPLVQHVLRVIQQLEVARSPNAENESEFSEKDGVLCIPRLTLAPGMKDTLSARWEVQQARTYRFGQDVNGSRNKPRFRSSIETPGLLDTLYFAEDPNGCSELRGGEVEIEVKATSMNFKDVMIALGQIPGQSFGFDGAGVVSRVARGSELSPGDAVLYCSSDGGGYGTFVRCPELQTEKLPRGMSFNVAAAIPAVWSTVVYSLDYIARLSAGETVLIHAAAGGVGQAAVQLAKLRKAEVFVTVGSESKRELVKELYGVPDDHIFNSRNDSFAQELLFATGGRGVDVLLNSLGGELLLRSWECIAPFGRFVDIGKADIIANNMLPMGPFDKNVTFSAVDLVVVHKEGKALMKKILKDVVRLFEENPGLHEPRPLHVFPPSRLEDAMRFLQGGKNTGKVVIDFTCDNEVEYLPLQRRERYSFNVNATYVISGGLGGLGREITRWMVTRGARNFVLLSSRGPSKRPEVLKFLEELESSGVTVLAHACDVSDRASLEGILTQARKQLPPIRGCIQSAMALRDEMLTKMSSLAFHEALDPKCAGSWNLHQLLPRNLDFFVLLSSFCGVMGNRGQANYAAGNAFEDGLARHRVADNLKAVSIDLVLVAEAGWAITNYDSVTLGLRASSNGLMQTQLMALMDMVCDPNYDCTAFGAAQIISMVESPAELARLTTEGLLDWMHKPMFSNLRRIGETDRSAAANNQGQNKSSSDDIDRLNAVKAAADLDKATEIVTAGLVSKLAKSLSTSSDDIDVGKPAYVVGVDSLIAVEIRYWFMKELHVEVPVFEILKNRSITELCEHVATKVMHAS
ncbi:putative KR domain-containing protein [Colletotrichum sublineola]|uniref:Putative KR domain-containing protein n=1 Tax=Colletotrichum sublineola TaxID=1173701 RepID=A0A066Y126_COLSU|nr:putative KR domain-containing protein [Colletotrichum sublineola]